jgi:hypothetical protein
MNAVTNPTKLVTIRYENSPANPECGAVKYTVTETTYSDGRSETHSVGYCDGKSVNEKNSRHAGKILDLVAIAEGRRGMGYRIVSLA